MSRAQTELSQAPASTRKHIRSLLLAGNLATISDTAPVSSDEKDVWIHSETAQMFVRIGSAWVEMFSGQSTLTFSETPPADVPDGHLWMKSSTGAIYVRVDSTWAALITGATTALQGGESIALVTGATSTAVTAWANKRIRFTAVGAKTVTIPVESGTLELQIGDRIRIRNASSSGNITLVPANDVTFLKRPNAEIVGVQETRTLVYIGEDTYELE